MNSKTIKILYWVFTILICGLMAFSAIPEITNNADGAKFMTGLGYPLYLNPFLGVAKVLGVIAILVPGFPKIREWAYAGFTFDLLGATYSIIKVGTPFGQWAPMLGFILVLVLSYVFYRKTLNPVTNSNQ